MNPSVLNNLNNTMPQKFGNMTNECDFSFYRKKWTNTTTINNKITTLEGSRSWLKKNPNRDSSTYMEKIKTRAIGSTTMTSSNNIPISFKSFDPSTIRQALSRNRSSGWGGSGMKRNKAFP
jgi:hypothetical protein